MMKHTIPLVYVTAFLFLFGETLQPAPRIAIYESIVCDQYYADKTQNGPFDCKIPPVQQELAFLGGIERLSIIIPSILAIPFAALADRYGHSLVLSLAIFGVFLEDGWPFIVCWFPQIFPIRLIWLHFFFSLLGGGFTVVVTLLHVIIAHVVSPEERTKIFFRARAAGVGASILGYAASGFAMRVNSWLPWAIGLGSLCLATLSAKMIPHTIAQEQEHHQDTDPECGAFTQSLQVRLLSSARAMWHSARILVCNKQVAIMLAMVFLCQLGYDSVPLMMAMYISKRFHWSFSDASFLNSLEMGVEFFALIIVLPMLTRHIPHQVRGLRLFKKEKLLAQGSIAALAVGTLCLGIAPAVSIAIAGIIILALGTGQDSLLRSMTTELVDPSEISIVYSAITMLRAIGGSVSGPIYAELYVVGMDHKNEGWLGLPFLFAGILFIVVLGLLAVIADPGEKGYEAIPETRREDDE